MKISKYLLGVFAVILCGLMTSCNTDVEGIKYNPEFQNISFEQDKSNTVTSQTSVTLPIRVIRSIKSGAYTANYTLASETEGVFSTTESGTINFADGQGVAIINLVASNMDKKGADYVCKLTLSDKDIATADTITKSQVSEMTITIHTEYNWIAAGTCKFIDYSFADDETNGEAADGVKIVNGEGTNVYRIVDPYKTLYGTAAGDITFTQNADGSIQLANGAHCTVGSYTIYSDNVNYGAYCYCVNEGNYYGVNHLLLAGTSLHIGYFEFIWNK